MQDDDIVTGFNTIKGNNKVEMKKPSKKVENDLNGDGVFDKQDVSIAGKTLVSAAKNKIKEIVKPKKKK